MPLAALVPKNQSSKTAVPLTPTGDKTLDRFRSSEVGRRVNNPTLTYAKADSETVLLASNATGSNGIDLVRIISDLCAFRAKQPKIYRAVDYFVAATRIFLDEVMEEYAQQAAKRRRENKSYDRFTWANTGQLAINYALACDCVKQLCDKLQFTPSGFRPTFDFFMASYIDFLMQASKIPEEILPNKTYEVKLKDWKKGGTRYQATENSEVVTNVRFPAARQRREKLESYLKGADEVVEIESSKVAVEVSGKVVAVTAVHSKSNAETSGALDTSTAGLVPVKTADGSVIYIPAPKGSVPAGPASAPGKVAIKSAMRPTYGNTNLWRRSIFQLLGGVAVPYYPVESVGLMASFVKIAETAPEKADKHYILRLLTESSIRNKIVLEAFDNCRGLEVLRVWMLAAASRGDLYLLHSLIEFTANRFDCYCASTKAAWSETPPPRVLDAASPQNDSDNTSAAVSSAASPTNKSIATIEYFRNFLASLPITITKDNTKLIENVTAHLAKIEHKMSSVEWYEGWGKATSIVAGDAGAAAKTIIQSAAIEEIKKREEDSLMKLKAWRQQQLIAKLLLHWGGGGRTADVPLITGPLPRLAGSMTLPPELETLQRSYLSLGGLTTTGPSVLSNQVTTEANVGPTELVALEGALATYLSQRQYTLYERLSHVEGFDFGNSGLGRNEANGSLQAAEAASVLGQKRPREDAHSSSSFSWASMPVWYDPYDILGAATAWAPPQ